MMRLGGIEPPTCGLKDGHGGADLACLCDSLASAILYAVGWGEMRSYLPTWDTFRGHGFARCRLLRASDEIDAVLGQPLNVGGRETR
jgi:hypothetical protein